MLNVARAEMGQTAIKGKLSMNVLKFYAICEHMAFAPSHNNCNAPKEFQNSLIFTLLNGLKCA